VCVSPRYVISGTIFEKNKSYWIQNACFDFFYKFIWNTSHSKKNWATCNKKRIGFNVKCLLFLSDCNESWIFSTDFRKILKHQLLWKSVHWEPGYSVRTDRRTDMTKPIVAFRNFANAHNNSWWILWKWETFKYLGIKLPNQTCMNEENNSRSNFANACCCSAQNI